jgi:signal transduction histidine kinase
MKQSKLLLVLLVILPLSLLAWLGTYLVQDAKRRATDMWKGLSERHPELASTLTPEEQKQFVEVPRSTLVPVVLAIGSGALLVTALGWIYFRETTREIREARSRVTFVNQISHELKTPLTNIHLYAEMAARRAEQSDDGTSRKYVNVIEAEASRLNRLISNVLSLARSQRGKLTVHLRQGVLDEVVRSAVEKWEPILEKKGIRSLEISLAAPDPMTFDPDAVEQILGNLFSNVEKYASAGQWARVSTSSDEAATRLVVEDRGPGVPASKLQNIFEPFERVRSDLTEGVSGTGIGLTISRELARLHGGHLIVDPLHTQGARFILSLPKKTA